jgi:hypothetical protein
VRAAAGAPRVELHLRARFGPPRTLPGPTTIFSTWIKIL